MEMGAGDGIEPPATAYEAVELPLLYPAMKWWPRPVPPRRFALIKRVF